MKRCSILWYSARDRFYRKWYYFLLSYNGREVQQGTTVLKSLWGLFHILRQICYSVLLARQCVSFLTAGQRNRYDFLCLIRLSSIQTHGPRSILVRKAWVKWVFSYWFFLRKKVNRRVNHNFSCLMLWKLQQLCHRPMQTILKCVYVRVQWTHCSAAAPSLISQHY